MSCSMFPTIPVVEKITEVLIYSSATNLDTIFFVQIRVSVFPVHATGLKNVTHHMMLRLTLLVYYTSKQTDSSSD